MKISDAMPLATMLGEPALLKIEFNKAERLALKHASEIAERARELLHKELDDDEPDHCMDTELAMICSAIDEVSDGIYV